nr:MAG: hypothetical protein [Microvirus sp.]
MYFKKKILPLHCYHKYYTFVMAKYISSVVVTLSPKSYSSSEPLVSKVLALDYISGSTISAAIRFVNRSPLITSYFSKYNIIGFTFKYSEL